MLKAMGQCVRISAAYFSVFFPEPLSDPVGQFLSEAIFSGPKTGFMRAFDRYLGDLLRIHLQHLHPTTSATDDTQLPACELQPVRL
jgi:hypothetical protein